MAGVTPAVPNGRRRQSSRRLGYGGALAVLLVALSLLAGAVGATSWTLAASGAASVVAVWLLYLLRRASSRVALAESRCSDRQMHFDALLETTREGVIMAGIDGVIEQVNPAVKAMFADTADALLGRRLTALLPDLFPLDALWRTPSGKPFVIRETEARRVGGGRFPARVRLRRLETGDGQRLLLSMDDLTESANQARQLELLEQRDGLTGLLNRREFERRMQRLLAEAVAAGDARCHTLCYLDIDHLKVVNDTAGHGAGDALLVQLATLVRTKLADAVLTARFGGDELTVLFDDCTEAQGIAKCEELLESVRNFSFRWHGRTFDVGLSIGLTAFVPELDSAAAELARADVACQMAKREGRKRVHVYRASDVSVARHHGDMHLVATISEALDTGRFRLYAQPIRPLCADAAGRTHYEILVRMLDEEGGLVEPELFIPAAERYILMPAVDRWVIQQLFATRGDQLRRWHREHPNEFLYAVNLSGTSLGDQGFLPYLRGALERYGIPPNCLCFEITETAAMRSLGEARDIMNALAALGCAFALDDFGTGLSSYRYLRELPVSYLKIDGTFVNDMSVNPVNRAMVESINQIAHVLGIKTIAEWAEDDSTINVLGEVGVDFVQGYAIGTPLPIVDWRADAAGAASARAATHG